MVDGAPDERRRRCQRAPSFRDKAAENRPHVRQVGFDVQLDRNTGGFRTCCQAAGIVKQHFAGTGKDQQRGKPMQVGVKRRNQRMVGRCVPGINAAGKADTRAVKHHIPVGIGFERFTRAGQIRPGRVEYRASRLGQTQLTQPDQGGERQPPPAESPARTSWRGAIRCPSISQR